MAKKKMRSPHDRFVEMFKGRHNIITVIFMVTGSLFIAKILYALSLVRYGTKGTLGIGILLLFIGYYVSDTLHEKHGNGGVAIV